MTARSSNRCVKRFTFQTMFVICLFGTSTIICYLAVSWKLSQEWTPDVINTPQRVTSFMIQPLHSTNMSISILAHSALLKEQNTDKATINDAKQVNMDTETHSNTDSKNENASNYVSNTSYHPEWGTINDPRMQITDVSYEKSDFSLWWTDGDGSPLFINASKYDKNGIGGYQSFVFCPLPKVGCSAWKQVMRRVKGIDAYLADDYWSLHHHIENGLEMDRIFRRNGTEIDVDAANQIAHYTDPITHKSIFHAVFVRDSLERSLSAFLDKCVQSQWHNRHWCKPQSDKKQYIFSHFDIFVEAIISKAEKPKSAFLQRYSYWQLDYHWLPQNWICDLYKFISRYHIYDADNIMDRRNFFLNIGGNKSWNAFGASGWFHHDSKKKRRLLEQLWVIPAYKKFEYVDNVNNIAREHPPGYRGYRAGDTLDISGSLLSENAAHTQNTRHKVFSYYRSDTLAKVIVFYLDDYVLFKRTLPDWICSFVNVEPVLERLVKLNGMYKEFYKGILDGIDDGITLLKMEKRVLFSVDQILHEGHEEHDIFKEIDPMNLLTFGKTSIWNAGTSAEQKRNMTERNTQLIENEFRKNTKLQCFYDTLLRVDKTYGTIFGVLRGVSLLLDVLLNVNIEILPNYEGRCVMSQDELGAKSDLWIEILNVYLNKYIPNRLKLFSDNDKHELNMQSAWTDIIECVDLQLNKGKIDHLKLSKQWHTENIKIFDQIIENMLYTRDVPRNAKYDDSLTEDQKKRYEAEMNERAVRRKERRAKLRAHKPVKS